MEEQKPNPVNLPAEPQNQIVTSQTSSGNAPTNQVAPNVPLTPNTPTGRPWYLSLVFIVSVIIICAYESFTKGWFSLLFIPASVVLLPVYLILEFSARQPKYLASKAVHWSALVLTFSLLLVYVATVGGGDTQDTFLFGFLKSSSTSLLSHISEIFAQIGMALLLPVIAGTIVALVIFREPKQTPKQIRTYKIALILIVMVTLLFNVYEFGTGVYENYASRGRREVAKQTIEANKNEAISVDYAKQLLMGCKLVSANNGANDTNEIGTQVRNSSTGIVLVKLHANPYNIWITDKTQGELSSEISYAKSSCPGFKTWPNS